jgi:hypothetical protein
MLSIGTNIYNKFKTAKKNRSTVPLYLDTHKHVKGVTAEAVAEAHKKDLEVQGKYGVNYKKYWVDEKTGDIYCLVEGPSAEACAKLHKNGLVADEIDEVKEGA